MASVFNEPHSTKQIEDSVSWSLETTPDVLTDTVLAYGSGAVRDSIANFPVLCS
jgi:hypothetical protein